MKRAIITVDLGYGDSSKGAWVDFLAREYEADLVVRYSGGSQCGHNVQLPDGTRHTFSQMGAGSFAGVKTYLGPAVIVNPYALQEEERALAALGIKRATSMLTIHPHCLVTTIFHQLMNRLRELARSPNPNDPARHGSCGHGIGETRGYWLRYGQDAIFAHDLNNPLVLTYKLQLLRQRLLAEIESLADLIHEDQCKLYALNPAYEAQVLSELARCYMTLSWRPGGFETVVFEGAQGVLLDETHGFHPHTTWSTVTPLHALELAWEWGIEECCMLGLTRCYATRHGAGPFPTYSHELTTKLNDPGNPANPWQGDMRYGWLDIPLLKYSAAVCGSLDGILLSHLDELKNASKVNVEYRRGGEPFQPKPGALPNMARQTALGECLSSLNQELVEVDSKSLQFLLSEKVGMVVGAANGPTHEDRQIFDLSFRKRVG